MLDNKLRHTFLTTYRWTLFIRRADEYRFELSPIISHNAINPTLRECFTGFAALAAANPSYHPGPGFNALRVSAFYQYFEDITEYTMQLFFFWCPWIPGIGPHQLSPDSPQWNSFAEASNW